MTILWLQTIRWRLVSAVVIGAGLALWLLGGDRAPDAAGCLTLQVRPRVMLERGDIRVEMRVERHDDHRLLVLAWDGEGAGSSRKQLAGGDAEVLHTHWLRDQAPGRYLFVAAVFNDTGKMIARGTAEIASIVPSSRSQATRTANRVNTYANCASREC